MFSRILIALAAFTAGIAATPSWPSHLKDGLSCARAITQLSCHSSYQVDPDSFGTCCYNGALQDGFKESGLVLSTQFWNLTEGPSGEYRLWGSDDCRLTVSTADSFTVHGLWPDYCDGTYPAFCTADSGIPEMNGAQIEALLQKYNPSLLSYMRTYYGNDPSFWEHEYNKHGTCFTTLRAKCQLFARHGEDGTSAALVGYFGQIVHQFRQLPSYDWLKDAGIVPSSSTTYKRTDMEQALRAKFGKTPYLYCPTPTTLSEIWYYYDVRGPLIHGQYVPIDSTSASNCKDDVSYLPKKV